MKGTIPAILIDSKSTWKMVKMIDEDMKELRYKDVKNTMFMERQDQTDPEYMFVPLPIFKKRFKQIGSVRIIVCHKRKK